MQIKKGDILLSLYLILNLPELTSINIFKIHSP